MDGKTHARFAAITFTISVPVCGILATQVGEPALAGIAGAAVGLLIDPDLDMHNITTYSEQRIYKASWLLGVAWECFWYPLARIIPHGSMWSHLPPLCTGVRLLYILAWVWAVSALLGVNSLDMWQRAWLPYALHGFAWWALQDLVHLAGDGFKWRHWT